MSSLLSDAVGGASSNPTPTSTASLPDVPIDHLDYAYIDKCTNAKELKDILEVLRSGKEGRWFDLENACEKKMIAALPPKERKLYVAQITEPTYEERETAANDIAEFLSNISTKDESLRKFRQEKIKSVKVEIEKNRMTTNTVISHTIFVEDEPKPSSPLDDCCDFPPIRNTAKLTEEAKNNHETTAVSPESTSKNESEKSADKIPAYDWDAWERFDVDEALQEMDNEEVEHKRMVEELEAAQKRKERERKENLKTELEKLGLKVRNVSTKSKEELDFLADCEKRKGNECFKAGELEESFMYFSRAVLLNPKNAILFANRALSALKLKRYQRAEDDCSTALDLDPSYSKAIARRAMARHYRGKYLDAIEDFELALEVTPNSKELNRLLGESRKKYNEVGGIGADRPGAPPRIMKNEKKKKQKIKKNESKEMVSGDSGFVEILEEEEEEQGFTKLTIVEDDGDDEEESEEEEEEEESTPSITSHISSDGNNVKPTQTGDEVIKQEGKEDEGEDEEKQVQVQKDVEKEQQQQQEEHEEEEEEEQQQESTWEQMKANGVVLFKQAKYDEALECFRNASLVLESLGSQLISKQQRDSGLCACLGNQATCHQLQGEHEETIAVCTRVLEINPAHAKSLFRRGNSYTAIGNNDGALDDMCQIIRFEPDNVEASDAIAKLMTQSHSEEDGAKDKIKVMHVEPKKKILGAKKNVVLEPENNKVEPEQSMSETNVNKLEQKVIKQEPKLGKQEPKLDKQKPKLDKQEPKQNKQEQNKNTGTATEATKAAEKKKAEQQTKTKNGTEPTKNINSTDQERKKNTQTDTSPTLGKASPPVAPQSATAKQNKQVAQLKAEGNTYFKAGKMDEAITTYSEALGVSQVSTVSVAILSNRAMAYLKSDRPTGCVDDCTTALDLLLAAEGDNTQNNTSAVPLMVKLLFRRASAHKTLKSFKFAITDLVKANTLEPHNKAVKGLLKQLREEEKEEEAVVVVDKDRKNKIASERIKAETRAKTQHENALKAQQVAARARVRQRDDAALPGVPKSVHEFQSNWRLFAGNEKRRGEYLFQIPVAHLCRLLKVEVNDDLLVEIAKVLVAAGKEENQEDENGMLAKREAKWALGLLSALSSLARFETAVMFFSGTAAKLFAQLFEVLYNKLGTTEQKKNEVHDVRSKYCK